MSAQARKPACDRSAKVAIQEFAWKNKGECDIEDLYSPHGDLREYSGNSVHATLKHACKKSKLGEMPELVTAKVGAKRAAAASEMVSPELSSRIQKKGRKGKTLSSVTPNESTTTSVSGEDTSIRATMNGEVPLYMPNERQWSPIYRVYGRAQSTTTGAFGEFIFIRVWLPFGITSTNVSTTTECSLVDEGYTMELKAAMSKGVLDASIYHQQHQDKIRSLVKALDTSSPTWDDDYAKLKAIEKEIDKLLDDEDNHQWGIFRLPLEKECDPASIDCHFHSGGEGDHTVLITLKVVQTDKYVEKKKTGIYKPIASPP